MKIAITGVKGMLGSELSLRAEAAGHEVKGYDLPELDITRDLGASDLDSTSDVLINCAAYTDVDGAESNETLAYAVNDDGAGRLAKWCSYNGVRFVHISTDYVFDGDSKEPYSEEDETNPLGVYAASKLAGEVSAFEFCPDALIVRTQALFGPRGKSFPAAIISRLDEGKDLQVVDDQTVSPTCSGHLSDALLTLIDKDAKGIVHVSSSGKCNWYEFALEIATRINPDAKVTPVGSEKFPRPAKRPAHSVLSKNKYEQITGSRMPHWKDALSWYLQEIGR